MSGRDGGKKGGEAYGIVRLEQFRLRGAKCNVLRCLSMLSLFMLNCYLRRLKTI